MAGQRLYDNSVWLCQNQRGIGNKLKLLYIESAQQSIRLWYKVKHQAVYMMLKLYIIKEKVWE